MEVRPWTPIRPQAGDLSKARPFALGRLHVEPSLRTVSAGDRSETLEPRVMRVLVALADAHGAVLSRDDLIALCWDGQIVGDNAINRVTSRLRAALADLAGDEVKLETITKVGFRLVAQDGAPTAAVMSPEAVESAAARRLPISRRLAVGGALAIGAAGAIAYAGWPPTAPRHKPKPEALELYDRGMAIMKSAGIDTTRQAMTFYKRAIAVDPEYADAWGALAIGYRHGLDGFTSEEKLAYPQLLRSAARQALALDPDQPDANLALAVVYPFYRRWHAMEPELRRLAQRFPDYWYVNAQLGILLQDVGRHEEALPYSKRVVELDPLLPVAWANLARAYSYAGRDHQADAALDEGFRRFPAHVLLWFSRYAVLLNSRRFREAAEFARDTRTRPEGFGERMSKIYGGLAEALSAGDVAKIAESRKYIASTLVAGPDAIGGAPRMVPHLAMLGASEDALASLEAYYLGGELFGQKVPPPAQLDMRTTSTLYAPPILAMRGDARFGALLERTGLEDYWKRSGSQPDFRRS